MEFKVIKPNPEPSFHWNYKSYGRIFLSDHDHVPMVKKKLKELDEFEWEYLPADIFEVNPIGLEWEKTDLVYCGKFDMSEIGDKLIKWCKENDIPIKIVSGAPYGEGNGYYPESLEEIYGYDARFCWE
jgi:hypothetical protein